MNPKENKLQETESQVENRKHSLMMVKAMVRVL